MIVAAHIRIPEWELDFSYARSSGPGGQNVNKVNSKAIVRWNVIASPSLPNDVRARFMARFASRLSGEGDLVIASDAFRDQVRNVSACLEKIRAMLFEVARPPKARHATKPTRSSQRRRVEGKRVHSEKKAQRRYRGGDD